MPNTSKKILWQCAWEVFRPMVWRVIDWLCGISCEPFAKTGFTVMLQSSHSDISTKYVNYWIPNWNISLYKKVLFIQIRLVCTCLIFIGQRIWNHSTILCSSMDFESKSPICSHLFPPATCFGNSINWIVACFQDYFRACLIESRTTDIRNRNK